MEKNGNISRNVIFLDFDGVMDTAYYDFYLISHKMTEKDKFGVIFDPDCVHNLENIIERTGADIVVSSSWKDFMSIRDLREMWEYRNLPGKIIGTTPNVEGKKGSQIDAWLKEHPVDNYVIIEGLGADNFSPEQIQHLFIANPYTGLDDEMADRIIAFLGTVNHIENAANHISIDGYTSLFPNILKIELSQKQHRIMSIIVIIAVLILIKWLWFCIAMEDVGTIDGEKGTILRRRNYLTAKLITTPDQVLQEMPAGIGEQFQGEWGMYTCSMLAQASANIAKLYPDQKERSISDIDKLISIVMSPDFRHYDEMRWGSDPVEDTNNANSHISYLSHLAWMISNYERAGGVDKYQELFHSLCENMNKKILNSPNLNLPTYPNEPTYIPDMLVAIVALKSYDRLHGNNYELTIISWIDNAKKKWTDEKTGIITSMLPKDSTIPCDLPIKGSYSALSCYYLSLVDYDFAKIQYEHIKKHFLQTFPFTGLKEYATGFHPLGMDIDAGPIILNLSPSGTAFFIGCASMFGDKETRTKFLKTAEIAGSTLTWNGKSHYWLANVALVGESIVLAMRTSSL